MDFPFSSLLTSLRRIALSCTLFTVFNDDSIDTIRPTGWDTLKKIKILEGNLINHKGKGSFTECVPKPLKTRSNNKDSEVNALDEQVFLEKLNIELEKTQCRSSQGNEMDTQHKKSPKGRQTAAGHINALKTKVTINGFK